MKTFVVGGAVRDRLLGLPVIDRDHVVVGATVDNMLEAGFKAVGRDFPVFLHPVTHEEYALARTERKVAPGYAGFVFHADPTVTLEDDLARRDLTINAIAEDEATGALIDPHDGRSDLAQRVFRHVGPAFVEDPVRLLRVARFAARFADFSIAPETAALMRRMADGGEVDALVPERVWQEVARGLMERRPSRMFDVLHATGALARVLPELAALYSPSDPPRPSSTIPALDRSADGGAVLDVRFAVLTTATVGRTADERIEAIRILCTRIAVPRAARDLASIVVREQDRSTTGSARSADLVEAMERSDAFRRPDRYRQAIAAIGWTIDDPVDRGRFVATSTRALDAALSVDAGAIAREVNYAPARIGDAVRRARVAAIEAARTTDAGTATD